MRRRPATRIGWAAWGVAGLVAPDWTTRRFARIVAAERPSVFSVNSGGAGTSSTNVPGRVVVWP